MVKYFNLCVDIYYKFFVLFSIQEDCWPRRFFYEFPTNCRICQTVSVSISFIF